MKRKAESLSVHQARKLVLLSQRVPPPGRRGSALKVTLEAIEHLGYIQIDTISAIQRAHHHTLWNRNPLYRSSQLDMLTTEKKIFEYWSHAAAYLPMKDFRFSLPRKKAIASGKESFWYSRDKQMMQSVLIRIDSEGPLMAKDFDHKEEKAGEWGSKPAKQALENLFMQGELMISGRVNFHKVYDLSERVLPDETDTSMPGEEEYARFLIRRYLQANGLGQIGEMVYLLKNTRGIVSSAIQEMCLSGELLQVGVNGVIYFALPGAFELLNNSLSRSKLKILSPFDNLLIQRKRTLELFNFDYQLECYVPRSKRKFGYFTLPVLWGGKLVARMDCKAERKESVLHIYTLVLEASLRNRDEFARALAKELLLFLKFNDCDRLIAHRTSPAGFKTELENAMK